MTHNAVFSKDMANKTIHVTREFNAPVDKVWKAWTDRDVLDKWWAPKPWRAQTETMDFADNGLWLYAMVSPEGEKHWSRVDIHKVDEGHSFSTTCVFSDENGTPNEVIGAMHWHVEFEPTATGTKVQVTLSFDNDADMEKMVAMGFEGGFTMGLNNLDELLGS